MERGGIRPFPPLELANRVCSLENREDPFETYEQLGAEAKESICSMLPDDWSFESKRVLDFGCGAGRTLRHFLPEASSGADIWGSDIDLPSIDWLRTHLCPPFNAIHNASDPPLDHEKHSYDLIWALSVFTHLADNSLPWLVELHRLLKPDGLLLATYMGRYNGVWFTGEEWNEEETGMMVLRRDQGWELGGPMVLMSDWWIDEHWGRAFEVLQRTPVHGQTWVLLRKRDVTISPEDLEAPGDDRREALALQRELRVAGTAHHEALKQVRDEYEQSTSWKLTRPLRVAASNVRELRRRPRSGRTSAP